MMETEELQWAKMVLHTDFAKYWLLDTERPLAIPNYLPIFLRVEGDQFCLAKTFRTEEG